MKEKQRERQKGREIGRNRRSEGGIKRKPERERKTERERERPDPKPTKKYHRDNASALDGCVA